MLAQAIHVVVDVHSSASVKARDDQPMALNNIDINSQWSVSMQDLLFTITSPPLMLDVNPYKTKNVSMAVSDAFWPLSVAKNGKWACCEARRVNY